MGVAHCETNCRTAPLPQYMVIAGWTAGAEYYRDRGGAAAAFTFAH
ncbi:hypothetical protein AS9A_0336 [Hoyosella subflava DQS3-9A1]|uniref:Uncharacterized protein n=1 Tax=Hoyosella subflava (strain DSM 45089 / JCM 17490 / NBRC 109087 / DQS3-9A1) TaxID=443218 RepID=F6EGX1_HOYSD|nr:hypothetical protein AS9A_0336 [Hoyosella subflava DQS3-9A1]